MSGMPWFKLRFSDLRDPSLRMCSMAARGIWLEMAAIMHEAEPKGSLMRNGRPLIPNDLSIICGISVDQVVELISELLHNGVVARRKNGVIFSKSIEKYENLSRKCRENGERGGSPSLCNTTENTGSVNPPVNPPVKPRAQYSRNQIPDNTPSLRPGVTRDVKKKFAEVWYPAYPHKVGRSAAEKAFATALQKATVEELLAGVERYKRDKPPTYAWCNPATWLNQERWTDEPGAAPVAERRPQGRSGGNPFAQISAELRAQSGGYHEQYNDTNNLFGDFDLDLQPEGSAGARIYQLC